MEIDAGTERAGLRVQYRAEPGQDVKRWFPPADYLNLASLIVIVGGVFLAPILCLASDRFAERALGLSAILFVGYPFAVLGHYNLLFSKGTIPPGVFSTAQEKAVIVVTILVSVFYATLLSCTRPS